VHLRVEGAIRTESIAPNQHATTAAVDAQVRTFDGLTHTVDKLALDSPGELKLATTEE